MHILKYMNIKILDLISVVAISVVCLLFFSLFLKDDISKYILLRHKLSSLRSAAELSPSMLEEQKQKLSDIASLESEMNDYKRIFDTKNRTPDVLRFITDISRRYRIEVTSVEPGEVIKGDKFTRRMYTTILSGGFYDVYNYMYRIEEDWKAVKIERVVMDKNSDNRRIQVVLTMAVLSI